MAMARSEAPYPLPGSDVAAIQRYFSDNSSAARIGVAGHLISAASLGAFTSTVVRQAALPSRPLRAVAAAGGVIATLSLVASACGSAALTGRLGRDPERATALH
jgi:hypothetical protein